MISRELSQYDGIGVAALIRRGEVSAAEVTEAAIARIEEMNPALNAVVTKLYEHGRAAAQRPAKGPLFGVPFLLKDIGGDLQGVETRRGSRFMSGVPAAETATLTRRQEEAGLVILGKTNVPEFGMSPATQSVLYGPARNPWNPHYTPGGSTGGGAAAVASGMVPIAHGGDAGGSIRMPASRCGLVGLKPTRGRNPRGPTAGERMGGFLEEHVLTRTVRDSAAVLDCTHGAETGDPYFAPPVERPFLEEIGRDPGKMLIAFSATDFAGEKAHPECISALGKAAATLRRLGHEVEEARPPAEIELLNHGMVVGAAWIAQEIDEHAAATGKVPAPDAFEPPIWGLYESGKRLTATDYVTSLSAIHRIAREIGRFMKRYDAWMSPVLGDLPERIDDLPGQGNVALEKRFARLSYVLVGNATGQPSISLPLHWTGDGLPIGVLFTARFGDDASLLRLAAQFEEEMPWKHRRPPMWG